MLGEIKGCIRQMLKEGISVDGDMPADRESLEAEVRKAGRELKGLDVKLADLYQDVADGILDNGDYLLMRKEFLGRKEKLAQERERLLRRGRSAGKPAGERRRHGLGSGCRSESWTGRWRSVLWKRYGFSRAGGWKRPFWGAGRFCAGWRDRMGMENIVALYIRISLEDDDIQDGKEESDSVTNQRALLRKYISGHEDFAGASVKEFLDDGYTGRNLDRPGFQELIGQCRTGKVGCIVVKDLSRLGRNYVEVGNLLEQVFPFLGVRVVSVNDGYDSAMLDGLDGRH